MTSLIQTLVDVEHRLWKGGGDVYRDGLADEALVVVPGAVLNKQETVAAIEASPRWTDVRVDDPRVLRLGGDIAMVTYRATARRAGDDEPYTAMVGSAYVLRDGAWLLAFHQQTPLPEQA